MSNTLSIIGAPSSAGAYGPGQEKAPSALRNAGLLEQLSSHDIDINDRGDVSGFRWQVDKENPRAMNAGKAARVAGETAEKVATALRQEEKVLVLGGDCTVELGTVAGALAETENIGLVYIDLDTDLNTPESTEDGALDWMGVAHMLGVEGTVPLLTNIGPRQPLLSPDQILFFANDNVKPFEQKIINTHGIPEVRLNEVIANPAKAAQTVIDDWAPQFDRLLIHLDVDVLDYVDFQLAENYRRNWGLTFKQLMESLELLLKAPNFTALTITEVNPDHGAKDGSTLKEFTQALAEALGKAL